MCVLTVDECAVFERLCVLYVCANCGCVCCVWMCQCECVYVLILHLLHTPERAWNINIPGFTTSDTSRQQKKALPTEAHKQVQLNTLHC